MRLNNLEPDFSRFDVLLGANQEVAGPPLEAIAFNDHTDGLKAVNPKELIELLKERASCDF